MTMRLLLACSLVLLTGCDKPSDTPPTAAIPADPPPAVVPPPSDNSHAPAADPAPAASEAELAAAAQQLTQVVRKFAVEKQRAPKSLDELVKAGYLERVPEAPPGRKFTINEKLQVQLGRN